MLNQFANLHRRFASLHGAGPASAKTAADFVSIYRAYAKATVEASRILRKHGKESAEFIAADIASMRLFHRVKKLQGMKKPRQS